MSRPRSIEVKKHMARKELEQLISEQSDSRLKERLIFIRILYDGERVKDAASKIGRSKPTGYHWLHRWNENGVEGLKPDFGGGRPSRLSDEEKQELERILKERNDWTLKEVGKLVKEEFGVEYSQSHLSRILKSMGMTYGKPYQEDYRRPENAEERLKESLEKVLEDEKGCILGFMDESRPKTTSNTQRVWSFEKPEKKRNTTNYQANTFGFYSPNGKSVAAFKGTCRKSNKLSYCYSRSQSRYLATNFRLNFSLSFIGCLRNDFPGFSIVLI